MSITKQELEEILIKLKRYSVDITSMEISYWQDYNLEQAYNNFWPRQYLDYYIYTLENIVRLYENDSLIENIYFTEEDIDFIFNNCKEILFYLKKVPYEVLP